MAYTPRKKHTPKNNRPYSITLELGGQLVQICELQNSTPKTMLVSSDIFDALIEELQNGKASQKAKT